MQLASAVSGGLRKHRLTSSTKLVPEPFSLRNSTWRLNPVWHARTESPCGKNQKETGSAQGADAFCAFPDLKDSLTCRCGGGLTHDVCRDLRSRRVLLQERPKSLRPTFQIFRAAE